MNKLPTPEYIAQQLNFDGFSEDQSFLIASEIYQPIKKQTGKT